VTKRVLLVGGGGFVGSHVLNELLGWPEYEITVIDSFRHNGVTDRITNVINNVSAFEERVNVITHDMVAPLSTLTRHLIERYEPCDYIIDVAARSSVDESLTHPREFIMNNVAVTLNTLELARELKPQRYLHLSTDEVYGSSSPAHSLHDHRPSSPYAASKAAQDDICYAYARTYGIPLTLVASANMFGERQSQLAFIPKIVRSILNHETISIHTDRDGLPGRRNYTYVGDVARWLVGALAAPHLGTYYTLPGRFTIDNEQLVNLVSSMMNVPPNLTLVSGTSVRPGYDENYHKLELGNHTWTSAQPWERATQNEFNFRIGQVTDWFIAHSEWLGE